MRMRPVVLFLSVMLLLGCMAGLAQDSKPDGVPALPAVSKDIALSEVDSLRMQNKLLQIQSLEQQLQILRNEGVQLISAYYQQYGLKASEYDFNMNTMQFVAKQKPAVASNGPAQR